MKRPADACSEYNKAGQPCANKPFDQGKCWIHLAWDRIFGDTIGEDAPRTQRCDHVAISTGERCKRRTTKYDTSGNAFYCHAHREFHRGAWEENPYLKMPRLDLVRSAPQGRTS